MIQLARLKVDEIAQKRAGIRAEYFPKVLADGNYFSFNKPLRTTLSLGGLGILPPPLPSIPIPIEVLRQDFFLGGGGVVQPLTQMFKIHAGVNAVSAERDEAKATEEKAEHEVAYGIEQLFYGVLITQRQKEAAQIKVAAAEELLHEVENAVDAGKALPVASLGRRAQLLESKQNLLALEIQLADYAEALNNLMGAPLANRWELVEPERPSSTLNSLEEAVQTALQMSPEVHEAEMTVSKAKAGVGAAKAEYLPDISAFFTYYYQNGIPTMPRDFSAVGGRLSYTLFDFGKREAQLRERRVQQRQAEEKLQMVKEKLEADVRKSFRGVEKAQEMVGVAREAAALRREGERLSNDQFDLGLVTKATYWDTQAARVSAEADLFRAEAGWRLSISELKKTVGIH